MQKCKRIRLIPTLLIGDNLGLNGIMGFVECFTANFFCPFCRSHRDNLLMENIEKLNMCRTIENYTIDCNTKNPTLTGIKEWSVWNNVINFKVTDNRCVVDIMHDLFRCPMRNFK